MTILAIPYKHFKEKIRIVKTYEKKKAKVTILDDIIYIEINET